MTSMSRVPMLGVHAKRQAQAACACGLLLGIRRGKKLRRGQGVRGYARRSLSSCSPPLTPPQATLFAAILSGSSHHRHSRGRLPPPPTAPWRGLAIAAAAAAALLSDGAQQRDAQCLSKSRNIHEFYKIVEKPIGTGGFGVVCVGSHRETGEVVAIKVLPKKSTRKSKIAQEVDILKTAAEHRNVVGFRGLFQDTDNWYVVMEMAEGGELFDRLVEQGAYSEHQASLIMAQIIEAVLYLHDQGIVHCDLKPENLMLTTKKPDPTSSNMRIVDFGSAFRADQGVMKTRKGSGTVAYSAPEVIKGEPCGPKTDMWALGVLMYILLSGFHPFDPHNDATDDEVGERIVKEKDKYVNFDYPCWERIDPAAKDLITQLLSSDPNKRPSAKELIGHPWIVQDLPLSTEPLEESVENLRRFHRGRRRLKALMLAVMSGLLDNVMPPKPASGDFKPELPPVTGLSEATSSSPLLNRMPSRSTSTSTSLSGSPSTAPSGPFIKSRDSGTLPAELLGSRRAGVKILDPEKKGYITEEDLARTLKALGVELSRRDLNEMLKSGHGDPYTTANTITHQQLIKLLPPLCPSKVLKRREMLWHEGEVDSTFYLLQKGEVLLRFVSPSDRRRDIAGEVVRTGDSFGEAELMINHYRQGGFSRVVAGEVNSNVIPRATSCECLTPRCELIGIEEYLFSLLTDVFESTHNKLQDQAERRCRKIVDTWAENTATATKRTIKCGELAWSAEKTMPHRLILVKSGFLEVEALVPADQDPTDPPASTSNRLTRAPSSPAPSTNVKMKRVVKRFGPGTYLYTKGGVKDMGGEGEEQGPHTQIAREWDHMEVRRVKCLTDVTTMEIPSKPYEDFIFNSHKAALMRFLLAMQEEKGRVLTVSLGPAEAPKSSRRWRDGDAHHRGAWAISIGHNDSNGNSKANQWR